MHPAIRWLPLGLAFPAVLSAQPADQAAATPAAHKAARLFRAADPLTIWMEGDFKTVFRDRDSLSTKRYPAKLRFLNEQGDTVSLDVQLATRGHYRLRTCDFVPLKVYFDKEQTKGTPFAGEGSLKLGTHCRNSDRFVQNTYVEYAANRMYNLLSPFSLKVRLARVTWLDPKNPKFMVTQPGIWYQDQEDLAKELRSMIKMQQGGTGTEMEPKQMAINDIFQYFIGNTDWSLWALHNYRIMIADTSAQFYPMAYDFDWSGLVNQPYAVPDPRLGIRRVTDRIYRSVVCYPPALLAEVLGLFKTRKDSLYGTLRTIKELSPGRLKEAESYLDEFYKEIDDQRAARRVFERPCRD